MNINLRPGGKKSITKTRWHTAASGSLWSLGLLLVLSATMVPFRGHLSVATTALVLVVPVVVGVSIGGFVAGILATLAGFLTYDFIFIPPYYTLSVGQTQNWAALVVYVIVMTVVAQVVSRLDSARAEAKRRAGELRRLFDISELLVKESPEPELVETIVKTVKQAFNLSGAALLLPTGHALELVASAGDRLQENELARLTSEVQQPVTLGSYGEPGQDFQVIALSPSGDPIGLLVLRGHLATRGDQDLLRAFTNHLALALERNQMRNKAMRAQLLEETDKLRRSLVGAVSHDLRSPLATIKVSTSTLLDPDSPVGSSEAQELIRLIDMQADRLDRLVTNLLDMTRIQSGSLELRRRPIMVDDLICEALAVVCPPTEKHSVLFQPTPGIPLVDVDSVLICQVLINLIDNAIRYSAPGDPIVVSAQVFSDELLVVSVQDCGPGIPADEREGIFQMFNRRESGGRGGLGLAIAKSFVVAHGQRIWVDSSPNGGSCFTFTLPISKT